MFMNTCTALRILAILIVYHTTFCTALGFNGGTPTTISEHPYVVSLQKSNGTHICAGALLKNRMIVTAAQCFVGNDPLDIFVRVGNNDNDDELIPIDAYKIHHDFNINTRDSDVAVVKLSKSVETSRNIRQINIAGDRPRTGKIAVVTGWSASNQLVDVDKRIIEYEECRAGKYSYTADEITENMICVEPVYNKSACDGEPGSPLVYNGKLVALVSWGYGCDNQGRPAVYTNVNKLRHWIRKVANHL